MYRRHISVGWYNLCSDNKKYNLYINVPESIGRSCLIFREMNQRMVGMKEVGSPNQPILG